MAASGEEMAAGRTARSSENVIVSDVISTLGARGLNQPPTSATTDDVDKNYVDSRIEAVEARTDLKVSTLATKATVWQAVASIIAAIVTAVGVLLTVLAYSASRFDSGMSARSMVEDVQKQQRATDARQDAKLDAILDRLPPKKP